MQLIPKLLRNALGRHGRQPPAASFAEEIEIVAVWDAINKKTAQKCVVAAPLAAVRRWPAASRRPAAADRLFGRTGRNSNRLSCNYYQNCSEMGWEVAADSALPCSGQPWPALVCPALPCPGLSWPALACPVLPWPTLPCSALPCSALPWPTLPCASLACPGVPCPGVRWPALACPGRAWTALGPQPS